MLKILLGTILSGLLSSCSTPQIPAATMSESVARPSEIDTSEIEKNEVLQRYQEMRARDWDQYLKNGRRSTERRVTPKPLPKQEVEIEQTIVEQPSIITPTPLSSPSPLVATPEAIPLVEQTPDADPESEIIADQKMRFHCSARITLNEKDKFEACLTKSQTIWDDCKKQELSTRKALHCLKQSL
ncbi:MAG: hypothetical protein HYV97_06490 [Bdellovibrio sp.]|nr:hypothetical protein [Bdellovibrio sp.]